MATYPPFRLLWAQLQGGRAAAARGCALRLALPATPPPCPQPQIKRADRGPPISRRCSRGFSSTRRRFFSVPESADFAVDRFDLIRRGRRARPTSLRRAFETST